MPGVLLRAEEGGPEYALFLYKHNAFTKAEPLYRETLQQFRSKAEANPDAFLPDVAATLITLRNLIIFYLKAMSDKAKSAAYAQEARDILKPLIKQAPYLQGHLDVAEEVLEADKAEPGE